jgi:RecB family exonuclease
VSVVTSWSPSRFEKYTQCPLKFKLETIEHLCPLCFSGKMLGYDDPTCDQCGGKAEVPDAIARGTVLHKVVENFILGRGPATDDIKSVVKIAAVLKETYAKNHQLVRIEHDFVFQRGWVPVSKFTKGAWLRTKADVIHVMHKVLEIIDWKSGGVDKKTKAVRSEEKHDDQLEIYGIAALCAFPKHDEAKPRLVFIDAHEGKNVVERGVVKRKDLEKLKKKWEKKIVPMFSDSKFEPKANFGCRWCPYSKSSGGPCRY